MPTQLTVGLPPVSQLHRYRSPESVAITTLCLNANIANTNNRLFAAICIVRQILKLRGLDANFVCV